MQKQNVMLKVILYPLALFILALVFTAYFAPDTMVALTNQVWALCGW
ncbi:hypothetical protein [Polynucleobacter antarcticus]|nr:hypothetical protein [Polynucleobacter antarcticus]